jgi:magnesium chelatase subunit D
VLIFDAEPAAIRLIANLFAQMLHQVTGKTVNQVYLGVIETEDDLWGRWEIARDCHPDQFPLRWRSGLLGSADRSDKLQLVVIPDLTQLSLAAMRACVSVMGTEVAHLERHSQQQLWQPNLCWLAGCAKDKVGLVSPHLLDRFALRLTGKVVTPRDRVGDILTWLEEPLFELESSSIPLSLEIMQVLRALSGKRPQVTAESLSRVESYTSVLKLYSSRRGIALIRLASAHALLEGASQVTANHVDHAAEAIGLQPPMQEPEMPAERPITSSPLSTLELETKNIDTSPVQQIEATGESQARTFKEPVYASEQTEIFESTPLMKYEVPGDPYPEDTAPVEREAASLKLPIRRFQTRVAGRGPVVGVEPARTLHDLALVSTLLEAAKYQPIRQQPIPMEGRNRSRLILSPSDLRCYRRAPVAEQMLTLVMDHTCLRECNWQQILLPYLSWAYVERASICLVQVGAVIERQGVRTNLRSVDPEELRARKIVERSILVPRISAGIEATAGKATPLAHGLELALQTLRHALQHGRSTVQKALLVVVSDGKGNVPLEASHLGRITIPVKQQGVEDALRVAQQIRLLDNVDTVLLNPQPKHYVDLPPKLAQALGVKPQNFIPIPPLDDEEVAND